MRDNLYAFCLNADIEECLTVIHNKLPETFLEFNNMKGLSEFIRKHLNDESIRELEERGRAVPAHIYKALKALDEIELLYIGQHLSEMMDGSGEIDLSVKDSQIQKVLHEHFKDKDELAEALDALGFDGLEKNRLIQIMEK